MSGIQYLQFVADVFGVSKAARQEAIDKYADMFSLTGDLAQPIGSYSHGMKQKLAVISALLHEPRLIIMDEPFVGLDPKASHILKEIMRDICNRGGAIFFSTHVLEVAEKLCDKVAIIKDGRLIKSGTMEQVRGDTSLEDVFLSWRTTMLRALIKKQTLEIMSFLFKSGKTGKMRSKGSAALYALLMLYVVGVFGWMFWWLRQRFALLLFSSRLTGCTFALWR